MNIYNGDNDEVLLYSSRKLGIILKDKHNTKTHKMQLKILERYSTYPKWN